MAWLCVNSDGVELIFDRTPWRLNFNWIVEDYYDPVIPMPKGTIEKIIGRVLTWDDEPVEI